MHNSTMRYIRSLFFALFVLAAPVASYAQVAVAITIAPPVLPVYEQPICPGDGYIWVPGYWAYDYDVADYYWVPGTWILAPEVGFFWTPGYWGWGGGGFIFYDGYWGPVVGFYGGIDYGFGYFGTGYVGGRWDGGHFFYNTSVNNVNTTVIHNTYNTRVDNNGANVTRVSFNGGNGGINARPTTQEEAAAHDRHLPAVAAQTENMQAARSNPQLRASVNHGKPPIAATPRPGVFSGAGVMIAKEGSYNPPSRVENTSRPTAIHPNDLPPAERFAAPNTGNAKLDKKYQQQQEKLQAKQDQEKQKLQQTQDQEHQRYAQQKANEAKTQQLEQKHQQQTQQLSQRQSQERQTMQQRQQAPMRQAQAAPPPAEGHSQEERR